MARVEGKCWIFRRMQREYIQLIFKRHISEFKRKFSFLRKLFQRSLIYCIISIASFSKKRTFSAIILSTWGNNTAITSIYLFVLKLPESLPWRSKLFLHRESGAVWSFKESGTHDECASMICPRVHMWLCDVLTPDLTSLTTPRSDPDNYFFTAERAIKTFRRRSDVFPYQQPRAITDRECISNDNQAYCCSLLLFRVGVSSLSLDFLARLSIDVKYL